ALQADEADDVLAAPAESLGGGVGHEAEGLDHGLHALPGLRLDQAGLAHDAGHRGGRDSRHPGDVVHRGHRVQSVFETAYIRVSLVTLNSYVSGVNKLLGPSCEWRGAWVSAG